MKLLESELRKVINEELETVLGRTKDPQRLGEILLGSVLLDNLIFKFVDRRMGEAPLEEKVAATEEILRLYSIGLTGKKEDKL